MSKPGRTYTDQEWALHLNSQVDELEAEINYFVATRAKLDRGARMAMYALFASNVFRRFADRMQDRAEELFGKDPYDLSKERTAA